MRRDKGLGQTPQKKSNTELVARERKKSFQRTLRWPSLRGRRKPGVLDPRGRGGCLCTKGANAAVTPNLNKGRSQTGRSRGRVGSEGDSEHTGCVLREKHGKREELGKWGHRVEGELDVRILCMF